MRFPTRDTDVAAIKAAIAASLKAADRQAQPYTHWTLTDLLPDEVVADAKALPFAPQDVGGVSGERLLHDDTRTYFDAGNIERFPVCAAIARAFHDQDMVETIAAATGADLDGCLLRIEYALDARGFWLEPHTDLGVKRLTLLHYLAEPGQEDLGTDVYVARDRWAKRAAFRNNEALMFVPSDKTWHGFEPRAINGVRKSLIINYVTEAWRDRWQLAFADQPVRSSISPRKA